MKKLLVLVLTFALASAALAADKLMGVVTPAADHGFTAESIRHGEAQAKLLAEKNGFEYRYMTANDSGEQINRIETLITMKPDVIVLWPVNGDELRSAAQQIMDAKIPLIIYDRFVRGLKPTAEISGDNVAIGEGAGTYFNEYFKAALAKGTVNYLEFKGDSSTVPMERTNGFLSKASKNFKLTQSFVTNWSQQTSMEQMENFLSTKTVKEIEAVQAIFTHDDEIVLGIVEAIKNYKGPAKLNIKLICGVAAGKEFMNLFDDPKLKGIDFITYTFSPSMVRDAIDLGLKAMNGEKLQASYKIPTERVDKNNYKAYMAGNLYKIRYSIN
ncbi:MAG: substrate-binding domain-containing protein [Deferribacteraceae bacterium]|jgi:ribose transport system substrate-binding protein|nr:substrate-binding domain-containing protein [Deferribacteraceae bacterium]